MFKNVAGQKVTLLALDSATGRPKTGDAANITAYVSKDDGSVTVLADTSAAELDATNAPGLYAFDLAQAETNADKLVFSGKSTTSGIDIVPFTTYTRPANAGLLAIDGSGRVTVGAMANDTLTASAIAANAITAAKIADGAIDAATFASGALDAVWSTTTRILTAGTNIALAKGTGVTGFNDLAAADVRTAVGLGSANLDTQLSAINAKTTNLPSDPADASDIAAAFSTVNTTLGTLATAASLATVATYIDTEVAAIKTKTDYLPSATAGSAGGVAIVGSSMAVSDKTGFKLASDGLDSVSTAAPSGVASNFREMVVQTWRRWFKKATKTKGATSTLKTYADDGTTVLTTQTLTVSASTETQGAAS